jgi:DNA-binding NarL/FixJ family response regulator
LANSTFGFVFDAPEDTPCVMVGNHKPQFALCLSSLEDDFTDFMRNANRGQAYYSDNVIRRLLENATYKFEPSTFNITLDEISLLELLVVKGRQKKVCEILHIHRNTLQHRLKIIEAKLGVDEVYQCIYLAQQKSWIANNLIELREGH